VKNEFCLCRVLTDVQSADKNRRSEASSQSEEVGAPVKSVAAAKPAAEAGVGYTSGPTTPIKTGSQNKPSRSMPDEDFEASVEASRHQAEQGSGRGHVALGRGRSALSQSESKVENGRGMPGNVMQSSVTSTPVTIPSLMSLCTSNTGISSISSVVKTADPAHKPADGAVLTATAPASVADVKSAASKKTSRQGRQAVTEDVVNAESGAKKGSKRRNRRKRSGRSRQGEGDEDDEHEEHPASRERSSKNAAAGGQSRKETAGADKSQSVPSSARGQGYSSTAEGQGTQSSKKAQGRSGANRGQGQSGAERIQNQPSENKGQARANTERDQLTPSSDKSQAQSWPGAERGQGRPGVDKSQSYGRRDDEGVRGSSKPAAGSSGSHYPTASSGAIQFGNKDKTSNAQAVWMHGVEFVRGGRGVGRMRRPLDDWVDDNEYYDDWDGHMTYADMNWTPEPMYGSYGGGGSARTSKRTGAASEAAANARKGRVKGRGRTLSATDIQPGPSTLTHEGPVERTTRSQQAKTPRKRKGRSKWYIMMIIKQLITYL
jgi:hypothetical protein